MPKLTKKKKTFYKKLVGGGDPHKIYGNGEPPKLKKPNIPLPPIPVIVPKINYPGNNQLKQAAKIKHNEYGRGNYQLVKEIKEIYTNPKFAKTSNIVTNPLNNNVVISKSAKEYKPNPESNNAKRISNLIQARIANNENTSRQTRNNTLKRQKLNFEKLGLSNNNMTSKIARMSNAFQQKKIIPIVEEEFKKKMGKYLEEAVSLSKKYPTLDTTNFFNIIKESKINSFHLLEEKYDKINKIEIMTPEELAVEAEKINTENINKIKLHTPNFNNSQMKKINSKEELINHYNDIYDFKIQMYEKKFIDDELNGLVEYNKTYESIIHPNINIQSLTKLLPKSPTTTKPSMASLVTQLMGKIPRIDRKTKSQQMINAVLSNTASKGVKSAVQRAKDAIALKKSKAALKEQEELEENETEARYLAEKELYSNF